MIQVTKYYNRPTVSYLEKIKNKYRYPLIILKQLVITDFKLRYQSSFLGYVWTLLKPLALFAILYIVFVKVLNVGADSPHFGVSLLLGIVLWNYFVEVTMGGINAVVGNSELMRKIYFPRYVVVLAGSFSAFINLLLTMIVVFVFMYINGVEFTATSIFVVFPIIEMFVFSLSLAFILSALYVRFRDVNYIWEVLLQAAFYATPIIYPFSLVMDQSQLFAKILIINPMAQIVQDSRALLIYSETPTINDVFGNSFAIIIPLLIVSILTVFAIYYFKKRSPYFAEEV